LAVLSMKGYLRSVLMKTLARIEALVVPCAPLIGTLAIMRISLPFVLDL
jgi:hypothetical protein